LIFSRRKYVSEEIITPIRNESLDRLATFIKENPDTSGGVQLRRFLWSLYNMHHVVNLWNLASRLSGEPARCVSDVLESALNGDLSEDQIKVALTSSGEMERWEETFAGSEVVEHLEESKRALCAALRRLSPCYEHTELTRLLSKLESLQAEIAGKAEIK
jgi:hypothetical protein